MPGVTTAYQAGVHGSRPAAGAGCILYACSTHSLIYRSDGTTWTTWMTIGSSTTTVASDAIWDAAGDLAVGTGADTAARLAVGATGTVLKGGTTPAWGAATALLLDYALASDISNQALTAATAFDFFANQNFTVVSATSLIEVSVRGFAFVNDAASQQNFCRINVDSGGTPILKYLNGSNNINATANNRDNVIGAGSVYLSGLAVGVHTIKVQIISVGTDHLYCRASTNGPTTGAEFLNVQVVEHL